MSDFIAHIKADLDTGSAESKLKALCQTETKKILLDIDTSKLQGVLNKTYDVNAQISAASLSTMRSQIENALKNITINPTIKGTGLGKGANQFGQLLSKQATAAIQGVTNRRGLGAFSVSEFSSKAFENEMAKQVRRISGEKSQLLSYDIKTKTSYESGVGSVTKLDKAIVKYRTDLGEVITKQLEWKQIAEETAMDGSKSPVMGWVEAMGSYGKSLEAATKQAKAFADVQKDIKDARKNMSDVRNAVDSAQNRYGDTRRFQSATQNLAQLEQLDAKLSRLEQMPASEDRTAAIASTIKEINGLLSTTTKEMNALETPIATMEAETKSNQVEAYINANTKAMKAYGSQLREVQQLYANAQTRGDLETANARFANLKSVIKAEGLGGLSFTDELGRGFKQIAEFVGIYGMIKNVFMQVPRQMFKAVKDVDSAMIELRKVSNASDLELDQSFDAAAVSAKKYGVALSDVISSTADWSRLGYGLEDAQKLADATTLLQTVGDNMTQENTSQALISTLQGFQLDASEAEHIVDKFNEVANNYAIDTAGIGEALQRSAASFNTAHTDLDKSIALIVGANTVVQDPARVGKDVAQECSNAYPSK